MNTLAIMTTEGSLYGQHLLHRLHARGMRIDLLLIRKASPLRLLRQWRSVARRLGAVDATRVAARKWMTGVQARRHLGAARLLPRYYGDVADRVAWVDDFKSPHSLFILEDVKPSAVLLAQSGILRRPLLDLVPGGFLNAHPGRLPNFRGVDIPWWTLVQASPEELACTLHVVDAGIDTGPIVKVKPFRPIRKPAFDFLEEAMYEDCVELLVEACVSIREGRPLEQTVQSGNQGKQYYTMGSRHRALARQAFDQWQPHA